MHPQSSIISRRACLLCGAPFLPPPWELRRADPIYCSPPCMMAGRRAAALATFWAYIEMTPTCWLWRGPLDSDGYGRCRLLGERGAHRVMWLLATGSGAGALGVLHNCPDGDTPACVKPTHLWLGDVTANNQDCAAKGRTARGESSGRRLHPEQYPRGDEHWTRRAPANLARGLQNGTHTHPERLLHGERGASAVLTWNQARAIRARYRAGDVRQVDLAAEYRVTQTTISQLLRGATWNEDYAPDVRPLPLPSS